MAFKTFMTSPASAPIQSSGSAAGVGPGGWHPTVLYMLGLVIAEMILVAFLSRHLLK